MPGAPDGGNISVEQPTIARDNTPRLASIDVRANPGEFENAQGLSELGSGLGQAGEQLQQISDKRDALFAQQIASQAEVTWKQKLSQAQQAATLDPSKGLDYVNQFKSTYNDYQQSILDANPNITQNAKNLVMQHLNAVGGDLFDNALSLQAKASTDWSVQSFTNTSDNLKQAGNGPDASVQVNPDGTVTSSFDNVRDKLNNLYSTAKGVVPTALVRDRLLQDHTELDKAEIDTSTNQNGAGETAKLIQEGKLGTSLTIPQRSEQVLELQRREQEDTTSAIRDYTEAQRGYQVQVQQTGQRIPGQEKIINAMGDRAFGAFGPAYASKAAQDATTDQDKFTAQKQLDQIEQQMDNKYPTNQSKSDFLKSLSDPNHVATPEETSDAFYLHYMPALKSGENPIDAMNKVHEFQQNFHDQVQTSVQVSQSAEGLKSLSLPDLKDQVDTLRDIATSDPVAAKLLPVAEARVKALSNDPFTVTLQDDKGIATAMQYAAQARSSVNPTLAKILTGGGPTPDDRANGIEQNAISRSISLQQNLRPGADPMVMSKGDADSLVGQLTQAKSSTDMSGLLQGLQQRFGPHFNEAIAQLHNNKDNPLPGGFGLITSNLGSPNVKDMMQAILIPDSNDKDGRKESEQNPGYAQMFKAKGKMPDEKSIDSIIQTDPDLGKYADAAAAMDNSKAGMDMVSDSRDAVGKYAKFLYLNPPPGMGYDAQGAVDAAKKFGVLNTMDFGSTNGITYGINKTGLNDTDVTTIKNQLDRELDGISSNYKKDSLDTIVGGNSNTPPDYTNQYNTKLSANQEAQFQDWKQKYAPNDSGSDYDLRGAFKAGILPDGENGHFPDTYKKPNHPTFSDESQYSTENVKGGHWEKDGSFSPSEQNIANSGIDGLKSYFSRVEPTSKINFGYDISNPGQANMDAASAQDVKSEAYWVTKSDWSGVQLYMRPVEGTSPSRAGLPVEGSFRSFSDLLNKGRTFKEPVATASATSGLGVSGD